MLCNDDEDYIRIQIMLTKEELEPLPLDVLYAIYVIFMTYKEKQNSDRIFPSLARDFIILFDKQNFKFFKKFLPPSKKNLYNFPDIKDYKFYYNRKKLTKKILKMGIFSLDLFAVDLQSRKLRAEQENGDGVELLLKEVSDIKPKE